MSCSVTNFRHTLLLNWLAVALCAVFYLAAPTLTQAATSAAQPRELISLNLRDVEIAEVMEMMSRKHRMNILLGSGVQGSLSLNLYDVSLRDAIHAIASAAGFAVDKRDGTYFVVRHDEVGKYGNSSVTKVTSFGLHYSDPTAVSALIQPYLSNYGKVTAIPERKMLLVEDEPSTVRRIAELIAEVDKQPQQILIEAKILEISLNDEESFGIDWTKLFNSQGGTGNVGSRGLAGAGTSASSGFFFDLATPNVEVTLTALEQEGRVQTLSTPMLLALENQEASVIVGDRRGYQVTTTINEVTSESIEFLESGVILRVLPNIDNRGRIMMEIHPEVSNGTVDNFGIPSQTTTEVTTNLLVPDGETIFIGGLMKHTSNQNRQGVPVVGRLPILGRLFSSRENSNVNTETVVLITPRVVKDLDAPWNAQQRTKVAVVQQQASHRQAAIEQRVQAFDCVAKRTNGLFEEHCIAVPGTAPAGDNPPQ